MIKQVGTRSSSATGHYDKQRSSSKSQNKQGSQYTEVYVWGNDKYGQLGLGHKYTGKNYSVPKICSYNLVIKQISCGEEHTAFITIRGHVYTIGSNSKGRLGIDNKQITYSSSPCLVEDLQKLVCSKISCGSNHTVAVMENGDAYSWGNGDLGVLGIGSQENVWAPVKVKGSRQKYNDVSCGARHTMILNQYGEIFACGSNEEGQLGIIDSQGESIPTKLQIEKIIEAVCGLYYTLVLTNLGEIYSCGANNFGQLGVGHKTSQKSFMKVHNLEDQTIIKIAAGHHSTALNRKGELFIWGTGVFGEYMTPIKFSKIDSAFNEIAVGGFFGAAVDVNGVVWTWGSNQNGELGVGDYEPRLTPFPVAALKDRKVVKVSCGANYMVALSVPKIKDPNQPKKKHQLSTHNTSMGLGFGGNDENQRKETMGNHSESTYVDLNIGQPSNQNIIEQRFNRQNISLDYDQNNDPLNITGYIKNVSKTGKNKDFQQHDIKNQSLNQIPSYYNNQSLISSQFNSINHSNNQNSNPESIQFDSSTNIKKRSLSSVTSQQTKVENQNNQNDQIRQIYKNDHLFSIKDNNKPNNQSHYISSQYSTINPPYSKNSRDCDFNSKDINSSYFLKNPSNQIISSITNLDQPQTHQKLFMPPMPKSPSRFEQDSYNNFDSSKRVQTEGYGSRKISQILPSSSNYSLKGNKIPPLPNSSFQQDKQLQEVEHNILINKNNYLEESLSNERKEKMALETSLFELRSQLKEIQYGKGGLNDLTILLNEEILKFEQLKINHDELYRRNTLNENRIIELTNQLQFVNQVKEDQDKNIIFAKDEINEKNHQFQIFQSQILRLEQIVAEKQELIDKLQDNLEKQTEKFKSEQKRTGDVVSSLNQQCQDFKENYAFLEDRIASYQESLNALEGIKGDLEKKIKILQDEIKDKENELINELQQKQKFEQFYYAECKSNEEIGLENKSLIEQIHSLRMKLQISQDNEQRLQNQCNELQEENKQLKDNLPKIDDFHRDIRNKDEYIDELESKCNALKASVKELEEKNIKLGELLNAEVDRQAEQYKQRTLKNLYHNAEQLYGLFNSNDDTQQNNGQNNQNTFKQPNDDFTSDRNHINHNLTLDSVDNQTDKKTGKSQASSSSYVQKPARVLQNNATDNSFIDTTNRNMVATPKDSPHRIKPSQDNQLNKSSDVVRSKLKQKIEDQKRKISSSAKKLLDILDNSYENNNGNLMSNQMGNAHMNTSADFKNPQNEENIPQKQNNKQLQYNSRGNFVDDLDQPLQRNSFTPTNYPHNNKLYQQQNNYGNQQRFSDNHIYTPNQTNNGSITYSPLRSKIKSNLDGNNVYQPNLQVQYKQDINNYEQNNQDQNQKLKDLADVKERLAFMKKTKDQLELKINDMDSKLNKYQDYGKK